jgi:hypothetical protein
MRKTGISGLLFKQQISGKVNRRDLSPGMWYALCHSQKNQEESAVYYRHDKRFWAIPSVVKQAATG